MWENSTEKQTAPLYQSKTVSKKEKLKKTDLLLAAQVLVCLAAVALAFFLRSIQVAFWPELCDAYNTMLTQGVRYDEAVQLVRFAQTGIDSLRERTDAVLSQFDAKELTGSGGSHPVKNHEVPSGASLEKYTLEETLTLPISGVVTSPFGFRDNPVDGGDDFHMGTDIAAAEGAAVKAALQGQVVKSGTGDLRGNYIVIRHRSGLQTLYQHLQCSYVRVGELVTENQIVAAVGHTGYTTGPHLHLEVIVEGKRVDPAIALPALKTP